MSLSADITEEAVGFHYLRRLFFVFLALAVLSLLINLGERMVGTRIILGGHSDSSISREVVIDNDVLSVRENMIRLPEQRRNGITERLDLYLSWPTLSGYNAGERSIFNGTSAQPALIFLSFEERAMSRDMSGRYEPIYKFLIEGKGAMGPGGLTRYVLPAKAGYMNEVLYVGPLEAATRFVARCSEEEKENLIAACERDIQVGTNLSVTLRFPNNILSDWRELDLKVTPFVASLIKTPATP